MLHVPIKRDRAKATETSGDGSFDEARRRAFEHCLEILDFAYENAIKGTVSRIGPAIGSIVEDVFCQRPASADEYVGESLLPTVLVDAFGDLADVARAVATAVSAESHAQAMSLQAAECQRHGGILATVLGRLGTASIESWSRTQGDVLVLVFEDLENVQTPLFSDFAAALSDANARVVLVAVYSSVFGFPTTLRPSFLGLLRVVKLSTPGASWALDELLRILARSFPLQFDPAALGYILGLFDQSHQSLSKFHSHLRFMLHGHFQRPLSQLCLVPDPTFRAQLMAAGPDVFRHTGTTLETIAAVAAHGVDRWMCALLTDMLARLSGSTEAGPGFKQVFLDVLERGAALEARTQAALGYVGSKITFPALCYALAAVGESALSGQTVRWIEGAAEQRLEASSADRAAFATFAATRKKIEELSILAACHDGIPGLGVGVLASLRYEAQLLLGTAFVGVRQRCGDRSLLGALVFPARESARVDESLDLVFDSLPQASLRLALDSPHEFLRCSCCSGAEG